MPTLHKKFFLNEAEIRSNYITPAIKNAGWKAITQFREEYPITQGRIVTSIGGMKRNKPLHADYVLFYRPNIPLAVVEAKDNNHNIADGMQQALKYAKLLDVPFAFSSNGDGFIFHNKLVTKGDVEISLNLNEFPSPEELWKMYKEGRNLTDLQQKIIDSPYYLNNPEKFPRYYQINAINKTVEAIVNGQERVLLVMATGTGKTFTAFQIIWRLWKAGIKKRILFLADRKNLISQTFTNDFAPFKDHMTWLRKSNFDTAHEIYLALYQGLSSEEDTLSLFKQFSPNFFDLVVVDECHRGSARAESQWRKILEYFSRATQIGLTATPKEDNEISNIDYFGNPIYTYTLKQGIEDGFLAPYRVIRVFFDKDLEGFMPYNGQLDDNGEIIDNRLYNTLDFDKILVLKQRTKLVAKIVSDYFKKNNCRMDKAIFFCVDQEHAARMREALINENADLCAIDDKYVMRITSDDETGVKQLDNFRDVESPYPVLVTTSKLLSTGVDVPTVNYIVLDSNIRSMTEFKQIIGRGTRLREDFGKTYFTIFDFRNVTSLFHDEKFDGPIEQDEKFNPSSSKEISPPPKTNETKNHEKKPKFVLSSESVAVAQKQIQYLDEHGKLVTESFTDYTRRKVKTVYATLKDFLTAWNSTERKKVIIDEMTKQGISFNELCKVVGKDLSPFDLILHIVFDQPPLTRRERAEKVRKRNYFSKYNSQVSEILNDLLDKYAETGFEDFENLDTLKIDPIKQHRTQLYIINKIFGSKEKYLTAVRELEKAIYTA